MANRLTRFYNAHETSAAEDFAVALICGDADFKVRIFVTLICLYGLTFVNSHRCTVVSSSSTATVYATRSVIGIHW